MDFSNIARQLREGMESTEAAASSSEKAVQGGMLQKQDTNRRRNSQKSHMSQQRSTPMKSDVTFASEEYREEREIVKNLSNKLSDWRQDLVEAAKPDEQGNHPYVDVMPFMNQKAMEAGRQMKDAARMEGGKQAKMASEEVNVNPNLKRHNEVIDRYKKDKPAGNNVNPNLQRHKGVVDRFKNRRMNEEESAMDKAMALMRDKYKGALMSPNKEKKEISDEERERRARNRAKFAKKEHDRLYGRKND